MDDIFCKIVRGEVPSVKIWEDERFLAILDIHPNTEGQTLVIPKEHHDPDIAEVPDPLLEELIVAAKKVIKLLKAGLGVARVGLFIEGLGVDHTHIKLYPIYKLGEGHLTTELGPQKTTEELEEIRNKIIK